MSEPSPEIVLASGSAIRQKLLRDAGIRHRVDPAHIDESAIDDPDPRARAVELARRKALAVSPRHPGMLILGADQVFTLDGDYYPKPRDEAELLAKLRLANGRTHRFSCGFALVRDGETLVADVDEAHVTFRSSSEEELGAYARTGEGIGCAGGYRLEEGGVRLIESIAGSHFTVLGLPMIPLIGSLRDLGYSPSIFTDAETAS